MAPGNGRKERPGRGEENHPDATRDARARWTEGARARMIGRASAQCGRCGGRHLNNQLGGGVDPADSRPWVTRRFDQESGWRIVCRIEQPEG